MKAYIISIGDELLIGQTINSNASFIGAKLSEAGIEVSKIITTADVKDDILSDLNEARKRSDVIIVTGGLGPTHDDITREAICSFFEVGMRRDEDVLNDIKERFAKFGREVTPTNEDQCLVPECCIAIRNFNGTAPGFWIDRYDKVFAVMPGVPGEMKAMMNNFVIPNLTARFNGKLKQIARLSVLTTGIAESTLYDKLSPIDEVFKDVKVAFLPNLQGVKIRLTAEAETIEKANELVSVANQQLRLRAGRYIYGKGEEQLGLVIGNLLRERQMTISVAESCTGGCISDLITDVSGSSEYFERGVIAYSNAAKVEILQVDEDLIHEKGSVSEEVAIEMAKGVRAISGTDLGVSITGILGPKGATPTKPVGLVYIAVASHEKAVAKKFNFGGTRIENKARASQAALEMVRRFVLGITLES
ncbi:MAG: competence/damage-inducible protein A [Ignavibacteriales bacterium]|nr:competence/damage-inducible protein A [Ignavibacteriales bacterium]